MSGFSQENTYWNQQQQNYYTDDYNQFQNQQLDFKPLEDYGDQTYAADYSQMYNPMAYQDKFTVGEADEFAEEPPLLEELEIYPDRILEKVKTVLNPFRSHGLTDDSEYLTKDTDLAGPIAFFLILAVCLFLSGNKAHFGYVYGVSMFSCLLMYGLLNLMTAESGKFTLTIVGSILGYSILPIVGLAAIGIFVSFQNIVGIVLASAAVLWTCLSASRLFVAISGDKEQQFLIGYPCALFAGVYALLVVF